MTDYSMFDIKTFDTERIRAALQKYDGDACRDADPMELANFILWAHKDFSICYCPTCVLARELNEAYA